MIWIFEKIKRRKNEESYLKCLDKLDFQDKKLYFSLRLRQDITSKWNWLENIFSTCRFEDFFRACFFDNNFLTIVAVNIYLFLWIFLALAALKKVLWVAWLTVFTYWILISYNESVSQLITGRPLQGPRLAARFPHIIDFQKRSVWEE